MTMTRFILAACVLCLAALPALAQINTPTLLAPDPVVASGRGFEIKRSTLDDSFATEKALVAQQQRIVIPDTERPRVESDILQHMVVNKILVEKATDEEKTKMHKEVDDYIDSLRKASPSEEVFQTQIKASGKTLDQIKAAYFEKQLAQAVLVRDLVPSNAISDETVKKFYDDPANATNFIIPESVHVAHILVSVLDPATQATIPPAQKREKEKLAYDLRDRAQKGEDFGGLVKKYSDDTSTKDAAWRDHLRPSWPAAFARRL